MQIEVGNTYKVFHSRKGAFTAKVVRMDDEFATLEITNGTAQALRPENVGRKGEQIDVRLSFCDFQPAA